MTRNWFSSIRRRSRLANDRGLTLIELLVAMGVTSVLLMSIVTASLFIQRFVKNWEDRSLLAEECSAARSELAGAIASGRTIRIFADSIMCTSVDGIRTTYRWSTGALLRNSKSLLRKGMRIDSVLIESQSLHESGAETILQADESVRGLYMLRFRITDGRMNTQRVSTLVRNEYEMGKYSTR